MQKFVILSVLFCFVVAGAVQIPTLSDQATFAKYLAAFADKKALLTTRQPGTTCLATPISCSIEGYIKGTQFQSLDIDKFVKGTFYHQYKKDDFKFMFQMQTAGSKFNKIQFWEHWNKGTGQGNPSFIWIYGEGKDKSSTFCRRIKFPFFLDQHCYKAGLPPFNYIGKSTVGRRTDMQYLKADSALLSKAQVEFWIDDDARFSPKKFYPIWHTVRRNNERGEYGLGLFFHNCYVDRRGFEPVWKTFPQACVDAPEADPNAKDRPNAKRSVTDEDAEMDALVEAIIAKTLARREQQEKGSQEEPTSMGCPMSILGELIKDIVPQHSNSTL